MSASSVASPAEAPSSPPHGGDSTCRAERNARVLAHRDLVEPFVRKYADRGVPREDLRQVGYLALVQAAERYDPAVGTNFEAFATVTIEGSIKRYFRDVTWTVRPPRRLQELHLQVRAANERLSHRFGREPTVAELADSLDVEIDHVHEAIEAAAAWGSVSVDGTVVDSPGSSALEHRLGVVDGGYERCDAVLAARAALAELTDQECEMLRMRFIEGRTQAEIGEALGYSQSYLSRLITSVLLKLRRAIEAEVPDGDGSAIDPKRRRLGRTEGTGPTGSGVQSAASRIPTRRTTGVPGRVHDTGGGRGCAS